MKKLTFFLICLVITANCRADIIIVDDNGPADFDNIQAAIDDANNGDTIIVQPGLYQENINFLGKNITLTGTNPMDSNIIVETVIDGNSNGSVVTFAGTESADCILAGFTIINGTGTGSQSRLGGGIYGNGTLATIQYNYISENKLIPLGFPSSGEGGGIYNCDGIIEHNIISKNMAVATDYESSSYGGGLDSCDGIIRNNIIVNNLVWESASDAVGGGMNGCHGTIENNIILGNSADRGGGIANCDAVIRNCIIIGNNANYDGGGIDASITTIRNCTIAGNRAGHWGGGIFLEGYYEFSNSTFIDSILWNNSALEGEQIALKEDGTGEPTLTVSYSDVQGGQEQIHLYGTCILNWGPGNIDTDPCFVQEGFWDSNGTPSGDDDFWANGDYHLQSAAGRWDPNTNNWVTDVNTSLCIDAGNPGCPLGTEPDSPNNTRINMGVFGGTPIASKSPADTWNIADLTNDHIVSLEDLAVFVNYWLDSGFWRPADLNRDGIPNFFDYAIFTNNWSP
jgi:hypothetical protein